MAYNDQSYQQRMQKGGDPAENQFRIYAQKHNVSAEHYGFDRSKLKNFSKLPQFVRNTPDFACVGKIGFLVECKGVGRDGIVKIKLNDAIQLALWNELAPLYIFANDSHRKKVSLLSFKKIETYLNEENIEPQTFDSDGKAFYPVPISLFEVWEKAASKAEVDAMLKEEEEKNGKT